MINADSNGVGCTRTKHAGDITVVPPVLLAELSGACKAIQRKDGLTRLQYLDGTIHEAMLPQRIDKMEWFAIVGTVQDKAIK